MGCLATLIVSPCVTPALIGTLAFIGQTGNPFLGATALFFLGLGMGIPLIIMAAAGGKLLPKAGLWMKTVENVFGVLLLAVALWLLGRILPPFISMLLWAALFIICAVFMGGLSTTPSHRMGKLSKGLGMVFLVYGIILVIGAAQGNENPWQPLKLHPVSLAATASYTTISNLDELNTALAQAKHAQKPVMIDAYADWCVACKEMDAKTFANSEVQSTLKHFSVFRIDLTHSTKDKEKLLKYLNIVAPPTYLFYDPKGKALPDLTVVGNTNTGEFMARLQRILTTSYQ
jgi:thiol:disulfide interchange protein DsbD